MGYSDLSNFAKYGYFLFWLILSDAYVIDTCQKLPWCEVELYYKWKWIYIDIVEYIVDIVGFDIITFLIQQIYNCRLFSTVNSL